ncbi:MAG TPA: aldo/keto reductase [Candidatus Eremiobacteraceae bacterium]|nr:aldo/keto reductase [Candidatus Eremiobacteraceae bacterium]
MREKPFGKRGPRVPVIGQGTWPVPVAKALRRGIDLGMTHIDTAEMYGDGESERIVGEAIRGVRRSRLFIVTKVLPSHADRRGVALSCAASLRRLGTDYVDCLLIHWRGDTPIEETMGALEEQVDAGNARSIGVSNFDPWDLREATLNLTKQRIACDQVMYNLGERTPEEHELPWCRANGAALVAYTPLGLPTLDARTRGGRILSAIGRKHRASAHSVALAFLVRQPNVFAIPKASQIDHVIANAKAGDLRLSAEEVAAIDAAFPRRKRVGPLPTN